MKLLFVDESKKQTSASEKEAFVLVGIMIDQENIVLAENELDTLKSKYSINKFEDIRKFENTAKREPFSRDLKEILSKYGCRVLSAIFGEVALDDYEKMEEVYPSCFHFLIERFLINLDNQERKGMIIHDVFERPYSKNFCEEVFKKIKNNHEKFAWKDENLYYKDFMYPQLFFGLDDYSNLLQASDVIAGSLNRAYMNTRDNLGEGHISRIKSRIEEFKDNHPYLNIYWDLFVKNKHGHVSGFGIKIWS